MPGLGSVFVELRLDDKPFTEAEARVLAKSIGTTIELERNWRALGSKSSMYFQAMKDNIVRNYEEIKRHALTTQEDILRAERIKNAELKRLNNEMKGQHEESWAYMMRSILRYYAAYYVVSTAIRETFRFVLSGIQEIDKLKTASIGIAAQITSMQGAENVAENYKAALGYATELNKKLMEIDANSFANLNQIQLMTRAMVNQGVILDINNQKQIQSFTALSNAVALFTTGQDKERQASQEIMALMQGRARMTDMVAMQMDALIKKSGEYKDGLKGLVEEGKKHGDTLERMYPYLIGIIAAGKDIQYTWEAVSSSMETAFGILQRELFADVYKEVLESGLQVTAYIKNNAKDIADSIKHVFDTLIFGIEAAISTLLVFGAVSVAQAVLAGNAMAVLTAKWAFFTTTAVSSMSKVGLAFTGFVAGIIGYEFGKILYDQFEFMRQGGVYAVYDLISVWDWLIYRIDVFIARLKEVGQILITPWNMVEIIKAADTRIADIEKEYEEKKRQNKEYLDWQLNQVSDAVRKEAEIRKKAVDKVKVPTIPAGTQIDEEAKKSVDAIQKVMDKLQEEIDLLGTSKEYQEAYNLAKQAGVSLDSDIGKQIKYKVEMLAIEKELAEFQKLDREEKVKAEKLYYEKNKSLDEQIKLLQMSAREQFIYNEVEKESALAIGGSIEALREKAGALYDAREQQKNLAEAAKELEEKEKKAAEESLKIWENTRNKIQDTITDFFGDAAKGNLDDFESYFESFADSLTDIWMTTFVEDLMKGLSDPGVMDEFGEAMSILFDSDVFDGAKWAKGIVGTMAAGMQAIQSGNEFQMVGTAIGTGIGLYLSGGNPQGGAAGAQIGNMFGSFFGQDRGPSYGESLNEVISKMTIALEQNSQALLDQINETSSLTITLRETNEAITKTPIMDGRSLAANFKLPGPDSAGPALIGGLMDSMGLPDFIKLMRQAVSDPYVLIKKLFPETNELWASKYTTGSKGERNQNVAQAIVDVLENGLLRVDAIAKETAGSISSLTEEFDTRNLSEYEKALYDLNNKWSPLLQQAAALEAQIKALGDESKLSAEDLAILSTAQEEYKEQRLTMEREFAEQRKAIMQDVKNYSDQFKSVSEMDRGFEKIEQDFSAFEDALRNLGYTAVDLSYEMVQAMIAMRDAKAEAYGEDLQEKIDTFGMSDLDKYQYEYDQRIKYITENFGAHWGEALDTATGKMEPYFFTQAANYDELIALAAQWRNMNIEAYNAAKAASAAMAEAARKAQVASEISSLKDQSFYLTATPAEKLLYDYNKNVAALLARTQDTAATNYLTPEEAQQMQSLYGEIYNKQIDQLKAQEQSINRQSSGISGQNKSLEKQKKIQEEINKLQKFVSTGEGLLDTIKGDIQSAYSLEQWMGKLEKINENIAKARLEENAGSMIDLLKDQYDALKAIEELQAEAVQSQIDSVESINELIRNIQGGGELAPVQSAEFFQGRYQQLYSAAMSGTSKDVDSFTNFVSQYLDFFRSFGGDYYNMSNQVVDDLKALDTSVSGGKSLSELYAQLELLEKHAMDTNAMLGDGAVSYLATIEQDLKTYLALVNEALNELSRTLNRISGHAAGGIHQGGLRLVGERGPELEYTGPSQIFSNSDSKSIISGIVKAVSGSGGRAEVVHLHLHVDGKEIGDVVYDQLDTNSRLIKKLRKRANG